MGDRSRHPSGEPRPFDLRGARVQLGSHRALDGVDFAMDPGEFVVVLGSNGSGKTTLVKALLGLLPLSAGELRIYGEAPRRFRHWERIGYVPQRFSAATGVPATVQEVVLSGRIPHARWFAPWKREDHEAAQRALSTVGLEDHAGDPAEALSGGQQQRVLIARALAGEPDVLVLDEPVSGVDLEHQEAFARALAELRARGRSVLVVAHALGAIEPLVERSVILDLGRVVYDGPPQPHHVELEHAHHHPPVVPGRP